MNCNQAREFILDGYFDGTLSADSKCMLESHMQCCMSCLEFSVRVRERAVRPFEVMPMAAVPADLWDNVRKAIEDIPPKKNIFAYLGDFFQSARFCYMFNALVDGACVVALVIMFAGSSANLSTRSQETVSVSSGEYLAAATDTGYGSAVEKYFL